MTRTYFREELEGVATFWRIERRDGVTQGFTSHDRDLWFDGLLHRAAPGMVPSAIRRTAEIESESAELEGALSHDAIRAADLAAGRYDGARFHVGIVDWQTLEHSVLFHGEAGAMSEEDGRFGTEIRSAKAMLMVDTIPRTSPTCRAQFCGPGCTLKSTQFTHEAQCSWVDIETGTVSFAGIADAANFSDGSLRWIDGPHAGLTMRVMRTSGAQLTLERELEAAATGARAVLLEGCDHTVGTCAQRFGNAVNFQGEPFLPGNDLLARYPTG